MALLKSDLMTEDILDDVYNILCEYNVDFDRDDIVNEIKLVLRKKLKETSMDLDGYLGCMLNRYRGLIDVILATGQTDHEAYYVNELSKDPTVVDLETNREDIERKISIAVETLHRVDADDYERKERFDEMRSLMLRELHRLLVMRSLLNNVSK